MLIAERKFEKVLLPHVLATGEHVSLATHVAARATYSIHLVARLENCATPCTR